MIDSPEYLLDANVFIQAARQYYAFDIVPSFWEKLIEKAREGRVASIDRVKLEIDKGKDYLTEWVNKHFSSWFIPTSSEEIIYEFRKIIRWVNNQGRYTNAAKDDFAGSADGWLVACAIVNGCNVVTQEQLDNTIRRKIKIPNICKNFDVRWIDTFNMLRELGVKLK